MSKSKSKEEVIFTSFLSAAIVSFLIIMVPHLGNGNNNRTFMPDTSGRGGYGASYYTYADKVSWSSYKCAFGEIHSLNVAGMTVSDFISADLGFDQVIKSTFEHIGLLLIITIIFTTIISAFRLFENDQDKFKEIK